MLWALAGALAILPLFWASRGPTLGTPVADDYFFLWHLVFDPTLDPLGSMGAPYYWRPVSRQLYFLLAGPWLMSAPWLAPLLAALLLLALYAVLYRLARRRFDAPVSAAIACFPLLAEPARIFLAWPSAAQHLLPTVFAALAVERAAAGRLTFAAAASLLALLSNEAAIVVLPTLPLVAWFRTRSWRETARWGAGTTAVAALWGAGYAVARAHGVGLPPGAGAGLPAEALWSVVVRTFVAQTGGEGLPPALSGPHLALCGLLVAVALAGSFSRAARKRIADAAPVLLGGLAWFVAGAVPLAMIFPDWNAWRTTVAALGLAFALTGWLALVSPWLAGLLVALRLAALLLASPAPALVTGEPPPGSDLCLARIVRLQRIVGSSRTALLDRYPRLEPGSIVRYWNLPQFAEIGFDTGTALQVWYRDSTLAWAPFGGMGGWTAPRAALVEYDSGRPWPATIIEPRALALFQAGYDRMFQRSWQASESLLVEAQRAQPGEGLAFHGLVNLAQAQIALTTGNLARADSLLLLAGGRLHELNPSYWLLKAILAQKRGDRAGALDALGKCLALDPMDANALRVARILGVTPAP